MFFKNTCRSCMIILIYFIFLSCFGCGSSNSSTTASIASGDTTATSKTAIKTAAGCSGSSPIWTSTPDSISVSACVASAAAGDTVNVISGSATWPANAVTIPVDKPLNIIGAGSDKVTITLGGSNAFSILPYVGTDTLPATRISGFKFISLDDRRYTAINAKGQGWRIDHCVYESAQTTYGAGFFVYASGLNTPVEPKGLIDNCQLINGKIINQGLSNDDLISLVWSNPLGLGGENAVYVEDCIFGNSVTAQTLALDIQNAGKVVFRYNTLVDAVIMAHGVNGAVRGSKKWEIYGNSFTTTNNDINNVIDQEAGTGVIFNNAVNLSTGDTTHSIYFANPRSGASLSTFGKCDGTSVASLHIDGNQDSMGWPCRDQIGRGQDSFQWLTPWLSNPAPKQSSLPAYTWGNRKTYDSSNIAPVAVTASNNHIKSNRDYYTYNASFDGTTGVGCGTIANRPVTCTPGVAYWATNQSCTNLSGMVGDINSNPSRLTISGTLYKCNTDGAWETYYIPHKYPHPLRK